MIKQDFCSLLIFDPQDEYFGRNPFGLKDVSDKIVYYSLNPPAGGRKLVINIENLRPWNFEGVINFSEAQTEAMYFYYEIYREKWIEKIFTEQPSKKDVVREETVNVLRRKLGILGIRKEGDELQASGVFSVDSGRSTISTICSELEACRPIIVDTSLLQGDLELLASSMITRELFNNYKRYKTDGLLQRKPVIGVVVEEAPRVLTNNDSVFSM